MDDQIEAAILALLDGRAAGSSICPSEAARACDPDGWARLMPDVRAAARRLADRGLLEVTQRGQAVDPTSARGPIRLRRPRR